MTSKTQAETEAQKIFYQIEGLVFDALRTELKEEIDAIITYRLAQERHLRQQRAKQPLNENNTTSMTAEDETSGTLAAETADDYAAIRDIINAYVQQSLEDQAPAIIAKILEQALSSEAITAKELS